jgi:hypothetical protein
VKQLTTSIVIQASSDAVWATLMDFDTFPDWNPFIRKIGGERAVGSQLSVQLQNPGGRAMSFSPIVTKVDTNRHFSWLGKLGIKGLFDGHHHFEIEPLDAETVRFTQSEDFGGALVPILWPMLAKKTEGGFESMNSALKARVEGS